MKYELTDEGMQAMALKLKNVIQAKYKDEIGDVLDHVVDALTQNYIIQAKTNCIDIYKLLDDANIR